MGVPFLVRWERFRPDSRNRDPGIHKRLARNDVYDVGTKRGGRSSEETRRGGNPVVSFSHRRVGSRERVVVRAGSGVTKVRLV